MVESKAKQEQYSLFLLLLTIMDNREIVQHCINYSHCSNFLHNTNFNCIKPLDPSVLQCCILISSFNISPVKVC
jgi:hypothetical protein